MVDGGQRVLGRLSGRSFEKGRAGPDQAGRAGADRRDVTAVDEDGVTLKTTAGSTHIPAHTVIWAAGVAVTYSDACSPSERKRRRTKTAISRSRQITIPKYPEIFLAANLG